MLLQGLIVYSPDTYLNLLGITARLPRLPEAPLINMQHRRNGNDLVAMLAAMCGIASIVTCFGVGIAVYVLPLPLLPLLLGGIGLAGSRAAGNPDQARLLSWIGVVAGVGAVVFVLLLIIGSLAFGTPDLLTILFTPRAAVTPVPTP
jgi:peptidoglycan/LPS O-acetylase OafA/YrhL